MRHFLSFGAAPLGEDVHLFDMAREGVKMKDVRLVGEFPAFGWRRCHGLVVGHMRPATM